MSFSELQGELADHDSLNWRHAPGFPTVEHNFAHLAKAMGRFGDYVEGMQDETLAPDAKVSPKYIADLAILAARFATNDGLDLGEVVKARLQEVSERAEKQ